MNLTEKDLEFVFEQSSKRFVQFGAESFGPSRPLTHRQQVCVSYVEATFALLVKTGILTLEQLPQIPLITTDSEPATDDYE